MVEREQVTDADGTNTLVLAPSVSEEKQITCHDHLDAGTGSTAVDYLKITYTQPPAAVLDDWESAVGALPDRTYVVQVRERVGTSDASFDRDGVTVATANPNDLTGMAMRLRDVIEKTADQDRPLLVCFDSLTSLLQYTEMNAAYRFLHMFTGQVRDAGAVAHFHLDPAAFDEQTISRVRSVFDEVVAAGE